MTPTYILPSGEDPAENGWNSGEDPDENGWNET